MDLAFETARAADAELVIANDPDADRLAVAVPDAGGRGRLATTERQPDRPAARLARGEARGGDRRRSTAPRSPARWSRRPGCRPWRSTTASTSMRR